VRCNKASFQESTSSFFDEGKGGRATVLFLQRKKPVSSGRRFPYRIPRRREGWPSSKRKTPDAPRAQRGGERAFKGEKRGTFPAGGDFSIALERPGRREESPPTIISPQERKKLTFSYGGKKRIFYFRRKKQSSRTFRGERTKSCVEGPSNKTLIEDKAVLQKENFLAWRTMFIRRKRGES